MVLLKIALVGTAIVALMVVAQNQRWPERARIVGVCSAIPSPHSSSDNRWYSCSEGLLSGYPSLAGDHCVATGVVQKREIWECDEALVSVPGT
jgi:hypothetical protein